MRKRISCKIIRSVPLGACNNGLRNISRSQSNRPGADDVFGFTRTGRPLKAAVWAEDTAISQVLDLYA